jgi:hypothetical protein
VMVAGRLGSREESEEQELMEAEKWRAVEV